MPDRRSLTRSFRAAPKHLQCYLDIRSDSRELCFPSGVAEKRLRLKLSLKYMKVYFKVFTLYRVSFVFKHVAFIFWRRF